jgi:hypothetical protein
LSRWTVFSVRRPTRYRLDSRPVRGRPRCAGRCARECSRRMPAPAAAPTGVPGAPEQVVEAYFLERERYLGEHPVRVLDGADRLLERLRGLGTPLVCYGGLERPHFHRQARAPGPSPSASSARCLMRPVPLVKHRSVGVHACMTPRREATSAATSPSRPAPCGGTAILGVSVSTWASRHIGGLS